MAHYFRDLSISIIGGIFAGIVAGIIVGIFLYESYYSNPELYVECDTTFNEKAVLVGELNRNLLTIDIENTGKPAFDIEIEIRALDRISINYGGETSGSYSSKYIEYIIEVDKIGEEGYMKEDIDITELKNLSDVKFFSLKVDCPKCKKEKIKYSRDCNQF